MPSETCALCHRVIVCGGIGPIENDGHIKHRHLACALLSTGVWLDTRNVDTSELSEEEKAQLASLLLEPSFEAAYSETLLARITPALVNLDSALSADHKCKKCRSSNASIKCSRKECNTHYHHHCINARDEPVFCAPVALCRSGSDFVLRPTRLFVCDAHFDIPDWRYFVETLRMRLRMYRVDSLPLHLQMLVSQVAEVLMFDVHSLRSEPSGNVHSFRTLGGETRNFTSNEAAIYLSSSWVAHSPLGPVPLPAAGESQVPTRAASPPMTAVSKSVEVASQSLATAEHLVEEREESAVVVRKRKGIAQDAEAVAVVDDDRSEQSDAVPVVKPSKRANKEKTTSKENLPPPRATRSPPKALEKETVAEHSKGPAKKRAKKIIPLQESEDSALMFSTDVLEEEKEAKEELSMMEPVKECEVVKAVKEVKEARPVGRPKGKGKSLVVDPGLPKKSAAAPPAAAVSYSDLEGSKVVHSFLSVDSKEDKREFSKVPSLIFGNSSSRKALLEMKSHKWTSALGTKEALSLLGDLDAVLASDDCADVLAICSIEDSSGALRSQYKNRYCCVGFCEGWEVLLLFHTQQPIFDFIRRKHLLADSLYLDNEFKPNYLVAIKKGFFHSPAHLSGNRALSQPKDYSTVRREEEDAIIRDKSDSSLAVASTVSQLPNHAAKKNETRAARTKSTAKPALAVATQSISDSFPAQSTGGSFETGFATDSSGSIDRASYCDLVDELLVSVRTDNLLNSILATQGQGRKNVVSPEDSTSAEPKRFTYSEIESLNKQLKRTSSRSNSSSKSFQDEAPADSSHRQRSRDSSGGNSSRRSSSSQDAFCVRSYPSSDSSKRRSSSATLRMCWHGPNCVHSNCKFAH